MKRTSTHTVELKVELPRRIIFTIETADEEGPVTWRIISSSDISPGDAETQVINAVASIMDAVNEEVSS